MAEIIEIFDLVRLGPRDKELQQQLGLVTGYAAYNYEKLANLPRHVRFYFCESENELPTPRSELRGDIAFVLKETGESYPLMCLKERGRHLWKYFAKPSYKINQPVISIHKDKLANAPIIEIIDRGLGRPHIYTFIETLLQPQIEIYQDKLSAPDIWMKEVLVAPRIWVTKERLIAPAIRCIADILHTPEIELVKKLGSPYIYIYKTPIIPPTPPTPSLHPAILGQAILGRCYLGAGESLDDSNDSNDSAILGEAILGICRLSVSNNHQEV